MSGKEVLLLIMFLYRGDVLHVPAVFQILFFCVSILINFKFYKYRTDRYMISLQDYPVVN